MGNVTAIVLSDYPWLINVFNDSFIEIIMNYHHLLIILLIIPTSRLQASEITFVVDDYCPYYCKEAVSNEDDSSFKESPGYVIEILTEAFKDYKINYVFVPWERGLLEVRKGLVDGIIVTSKYNAVDLIFPKVAQGSSIGCFYTAKNNTWRYQNKHSLPNIHLGLIKNYDYAEPVNSYVMENIRETNKQLSPLYFMSGTQPLTRLINMINTNRLDATFDDKNVVDNILKLNELTAKIKNVGCLSDAIDLFVAFTPTKKSSSVYATTLATTVSKLRDSGELAAILAKYGLVDWQ